MINILFICAPFFNSLTTNELTKLRCSKAKGNQKKTVLKKRETFVSCCVWKIACETIFSKKGFERLKQYFLEKFRKKGLHHWWVLHEDFIILCPLLHSALVYSGTTLSFVYVKNQAETKHVAEQDLWDVSLESQQVRGYLIWRTVQTFHFSLFHQMYLF